MIDYIYEISIIVFIFAISLIISLAIECHRKYKSRILLTETLLVDPESNQLPHLQIPQLHTSAAR